MLRSQAVHQRLGRIARGNLDPSEKNQKARVLEAGVTLGRLRGREKAGGATIKSGLVTVEEEVQGVTGESSENRVVEEEVVVVVVEVAGEEIRRRKGQWVGRKWEEGKVEVGDREEVGEEEEETGGREMPSQ